MSISKVTVARTSSGVTTATVTPQQSVIVSSHQLNLNTTNLGDPVNVDVTSGEATTAAITPQQSISVSSYRLNQNTTNLGDLVDVDVTSTTDGSLLTYNSGSQKWEATTLIEKPSVELNGGFF